MIFSFNFEEFIEELREHPKKSEIVKKYEEIYWPIKWGIQDQIWYKDYISKFETVEYKVPLEYKDDFDWDLLMRLVAWSFSSEGYLEFEEKEQLPELLISVTSWDTHIVKKVSELFSFQIKRLYEIYVEEQLELQILIWKWEEKEYIESKRVSRLERRKTVLDKIRWEIEKKKEEQERQKKLQELMNKL